jgi:16S rRNA (guanine527-N7)-methyltransferase
MTSVPRETRERLDQLANLVIEENQRQNLVSVSTLDAFETRHIEDSLQLAPLLPRGVLIDIGSGAGFPGLALSCVRDDPVHLVEPRARRAEFLSRAADDLGLPHVTVHASKIERVQGVTADAITARAVANLSALFAMAAHCATPNTRWVLPKGRSAQSELDAARETWQGRFELVPSRTDPDAAIVLAHGVRRRKAT